MVVRHTIIILAVILMAGLLFPQASFAQFADSAEAGLQQRNIDVEKVKRECEEQAVLDAPSVCPRLVGPGLFYANDEECNEGLIQICLKAVIEEFDIAEQQKQQAVNTRSRTRALFPTRITRGLSSLNQLGVTSVSDFTNRVVRVALSFMGTLALAMLIYGGVLWMFSQGNADKAKKATKVIVWSVLGIVVIVSSYAIINFILEAFTA